MPTFNQTLAQVMRAGQLGRHGSAPISTVLPRRNTDPGVSHTFSRHFSKQSYPKCISDVVSKILEKKKTQLSDVLPEFVIFLKLGFLWLKLKIFSPIFLNFSPNRYWRIFSMLLNSHPTVKWR